MAAAGWNPGKQTLAQQNADGTWSIPSFRGEEAVYIVNLEMRSCSCPHHQRRGAVCKHLVSAAEQATFAGYLAKAERCTDEQLEKLLVRYLDDERISGAIRCERARRKAARLGPRSVTGSFLDDARIRKAAEQAKRDAELKKIFA